MPIFGRTAPTPELTAEAAVDRFHVAVELAPHYATDVMDLVQWDEDQEYRLALNVHRQRFHADSAEWHAELERATKHLDGSSKRSVWARLAERGPLKYTPDPDTAGAWVKGLTDDDRRYWLHLRALERAQAAYTRMQSRAAQATVKHEFQTCRVCGQGGGSVSWWHLNGPFIEPGTSGTVRACRPCAAALAEHVAGAAAAELVNGRTRLQLAADWIEANQ